MKYLFKNAPMQTTAAPPSVATGAAIKTMLQVKGVVPFRIVEWGYSFDAFAAAQPGKIELIETGTVFATVTAFVNADIDQLDAEAVLFGDPTTALFSVGVSASGYTASVEGTVVAVRNLAGPQLTAPTNQFIEQFAPGERPLVQAGKSMRIRMTLPATVNAYCYVIVEV